MTKSASQAAFVGSLPHNPYCTDEPSAGLRIRSKPKALAYRHIQHNPPPHVASLVFDVDRANAFYDWRDRGLPAPHWIAINWSNGHAHLGYMLATPVARTSAAKRKPLAYLAAIEHVLTHRLGADVGYAGLITKNPVHSDWHTTWYDHEPYSLDYLAEFCPDKDLAAYSRRSRKEASGLGRNVALFDTVREWAYSAVREFWRPDGYDAWAEAVQAACAQTNAFGLEQGGPLPHSEIKATAKSIARWVWRHFTPSEFRAVQAVRGAKGGKVSKRPTKSGKVREELLQEVIWRHTQGYSNRDIAEDLGIGAATVSRYLRFEPK